MQHQKAIEQLGYNNKEAKVYLTALRLGECRISEIATLVDLPLSSTKVIAEKLSKDGLLTSYSMKGATYWVAENPERLLQNLLKRESAVKEILPELLAVRKASRGKRYKKKGGSHLLNILQVIADASPQAILVADKDTEIQYVNFVWEKEFGYLLGEVRGEKMDILKNAETADSVHEDMWKSLSSKTLFQSDQIIQKRKDGSLFRIRTIILPLELNGHLFYVHFLSDVESAEDRVYDMTIEFTSGVNKIINDRMMNEERREGNDRRKRE